MKGSITISRPTYSNDKEVIKIQIKDKLSRIGFLEIELSYSEFAQCLTGLSEVNCELEIRSLEKVGLVKLTDSLIFPIGDCTFKDRTSVAYIEANRLLTERGDEWTASLYFRSKDSFFMKDGEQMARATINKWVKNNEL